MQTIRLIVNDKIYKHLMWFLRRFNKEEIQVISENNEFISISEYLNEELEKIENGSAGFTSVNQLEDDLETTIRHHEA